MSEPNKYFRLLKTDELKAVGDLQPTVRSRELEPICYPGEPCRPRGIVLRPVQVDEWIEYAKQKPTEADGDGGAKWVQWWSPGSGGTGSSFGNPPLGATHWRRITPPQPIIKRVKVREELGSEREVIPQADGSLKVGCVTIAAKDFDEIVRQRAEAMGK